jgi:hypothetical protein
MRRLAPLVVAAILLALAGTSAASVAKAPPPQFPALPGPWTHITINRKIHGEWHTLILDRGRIIQAGAKKMTLLESDGTTVPIELDVATIVQPPGLGMTVFDLRRGMGVDAMRIDGGPAVRVRVRVLGARRLRAAQ